MFLLVTAEHQLFIPLLHFRFVHFVKEGMARCAKKGRRLIFLAHITIYCLLESVIEKAKNRFLKVEKIILYILLTAGSLEFLK